ncbi:MAG: ABC transporter permease [Chloroflexi bacterium]|nr:ABC transporter permease [Chloroflexota bacterium]MDA1241039.1 ABC transporter permease [Chloroflexota bacterium]
MLMARRSLYRFIRLPDWLFFSTAQPVMFVLLFTYVFGGAIQVPTGNYIDFLLPGILVQSVLFGTSATAVGLAEDISKGAFDRYRSLPMSRSAVLAGRILADTANNVFVMGLMILVGYLIGFRFQGTLLQALSMPVVVIIFTIPFSWIQAWIGTAVKSVEAANLAGFVWMFPLTFVSSAFVPIDSMPGWLQPVAQANPFSVAVDAARALALGQEAGPDVVKTLLWSAAIMIVVVPLAVRGYRRA